jgi:hypothetical protein
MSEEANVHRTQKIDPKILYDQMKKENTRAIKMSHDAMADSECPSPMVPKSIAHLAERSISNQETMCEIQLATAIDPETVAKKIVEVEKQDGNGILIQKGNFTLKTDNVRDFVRVVAGAAILAMALKYFGILNLVMEWFKR